MHRSAVALSLILVLAGWGRAQDKKDDFKWDPKKKRAPAVGERYFAVEEETRKMKSKVAVQGQEPHNEDATSSIKYRVVHEILAVVQTNSTTQVSKERILVERWSVAAEGQDDDKSLEGKAVLIDGIGEDRKVQIDGSNEGVTDLAKEWLKRAFLREKDEQTDKLMPKEPIGNDGEWTLDPKELAADIFEGTEIVPEKSSGKGTLKNVRVEDGVHMGDLEIAIAIQLKKVPNQPLEWKEGGLLEMNVTMTGSLEENKARRKSYKMTVKLKGRSEQETEMGPITLKLDMQMNTSASEGDMPRSDK